MGITLSQVLPKSSDGIIFLYAPVGFFILCCYSLGEHIMAHVGLLIQMNKYLVPLDSLMDDAVYHRGSGARLPVLFYKLCHLLL